MKGRKQEITFEKLEGEVASWDKPDKADTAVIVPVLAWRRKWEEKEINPKDKVAREEEEEDIHESCPWQENRKNDRREYPIHRPREAGKKKISRTET